MPRRGARANASVGSGAGVRRRNSACCSPKWDVRRHSRGLLAINHPPAGPLDLHFQRLSMRGSAYNGKHCPPEEFTGAIRIDGHTTIVALCATVIQAALSPPWRASNLSRFLRGPVDHVGDDAGMGQERDVTAVDLGDLRADPLGGLPQHPRIDRLS